MGWLARIYFLGLMTLVCCSIWLAGISVVLLGVLVPVCPFSSGFPLFV